MNPAFVLAFENAAWPVLALDNGGMIVHANRAAITALGAILKPDGTSAASIWSPENELSWEALLTKANPPPGGRMTLRFRTESGATAAFETSICSFTSDQEKYHVLQLIRPASGPEAKHPEPIVFKPAIRSGVGAKMEPSALESGLAHKQKLDCALQLTRTVALDFNNALTSILGHTSLILSKMEPNHPWRNSLVEVEKSAEKAAEVASDLAAFSRQEKDGRSQVDGNLNDLVRRTVELFQGPGSRRAEWKLHLEPRLYTATFEEAKMQQAFVKILENALQAIADGGAIAVGTRNQLVAEPVHERNLHLTPGPYVCVEFEDTGCGIAPEVLPRIFEPFFSTKKLPDHRGLGLAWVYGIVTNHGGSVAVSSQLGRGTTVRVYLPARKKIIRDRAVQTDDLNGTQTILMIDDEELLLTMGEMVLSSFGYRVFTANSGQKALELFSKHQAQIDLVITDLVMPKMSGRELIEQLRRLAPQVRIICSSGYIRALTPEEEDMYLQKPFTSVDLLRKVKQALTHPD